MSFYNTTNESGDKLRSYRGRSESQEVVVLAFFSSHSGSYSPSQIHERVGSQSPLTSTRRAITNLTTDGKLVKLDRKIRGPFGRPEYLWQRAQGQRSLF